MKEDRIYSWSEWAASGIDVVVLIPSDRGSDTAARINHAGGFAVESFRGHGILVGTISESGVRRTPGSLVGVIRQPAA